MARTDVSSGSTAACLAHRLSEPKSEGRRFDPPLATTVTRR